jgi:hypothetical protein
MNKMTEQDFLKRAIEILDKGYPVQGFRNKPYEPKELAKKLKENYEKQLNIIDDNNSH